MAQAVLVQVQSRAPFVKRSPSELKCQTSFPICLFKYSCDMEFGAGQFEDLNFLQANFRPKVADHLSNGLFLGLPQWGVSEWKGLIYPKELRLQEFLETYAKLYSCVEVSSSFYAPIDTKTLETWLERVPSGFRFLPKWPKRLTHDLQLRASVRELTTFIETMGILGPNLGASLLQLPPHFSYEHRRELFLFLQRLPKDFPVCLELRHSSWFESQNVLPRLYDYLYERNIGLVLSDTPQRRDLFHLNSSGPHFLVRYLSDDNQEMDEKRLGRWKELLSELSEKTNAYFIFHKPDNTLTPSLTSFLDEKFEKRRKELLIDTEQLGLL